MAKADSKQTFASAICNFEGREILDDNTVRKILYGVMLKMVIKLS